MNSFLNMITDAWLPLVLTAACAYALGSISFAIIITRIIGKTDIRDSGSGNAGATNVLRSQGKLPALLTTIGDLSKSIAAVLVGSFLIRTLNNYSDLNSLLLIDRYIAGVFCILGHLYPLYFGFRGGKGVMAALGVMLVLDWKIALLCLGIFLIITVITKMVSIGSISAAIVLPVLTWLFNTIIYSDTKMWDTAFCTIMSAIVGLMLVVKHKTNIIRIIQGTEHKIGSRK